MAVYPYTGKLTDFGDAPFPNAVPRLWVAAKNDAISPSGLAAARPISVAVATNGSFSVDLTASIDLTPPTPYTFRCDWLTEDDEPLGYAEWEFTAQIGGGPIATMPGVLTRVWYATTQPPVNRSGIYWIHPTTGDLQAWS